MDDDIDSLLFSPATPEVADRRGADARARTVSLLAVGAFCAVLLILLGVTMVAKVALEPAIGFHGARLGLVARDIRDRFDLPGSWRAGPEELVWAPNDPAQSVREAHFEFHMGSLVAIRALVRSSDVTATGAPLESTHASVLARTQREDGDVAVFLVARDCPTHAAEVTRLLGGQ